MINDKLTSIVLEVLPSARIEVFALTNGTGIRLYLMNADYPRQQLSAEATRQLMEQPFYWAFCWASGLVLSEYVINNPQLVAGKRVVDFGSGSGVVAIAAARAGAAEVIACDTDPLARLAISENCRLNQVAVNTSDDFDAIEGPVDMIFVADVLYDSDNLPWLGHFIERAACVLVADSRVKDFSFPAYRQVARMQGCTLPDLDESPEFRDVRLYVGLAATGAGAGPGP